MPADASGSGHTRATVPFVSMRGIHMNVLLAGCAAVVLMAVAVPAVAAATKGSSADAKFKALYTAEWKWREDQFAGGEDDVKEIADHLIKVDPATQETRLHYWEKTLKGLEAIPRAKLSAANQVNYDVYKPQLQVLIADQKFRAFEMPANSDTTFWTDLGYTARQDFRNLKDYQHWIAQMRDVPRYFHEQMDEMRAGLKRGFTPAQVTLQGRDASISERHRRQAGRLALLHAVQDHARHRA